MAAMLGADPDRLDDLARRMRDAAAQLQRIERQLTRLVNAQVWVGPVADRYRQEWNSRHRASLSRAATALAHNDRLLHVNAEQQRRASAAGRGYGRALPPRNLGFGDLLDLGVPGLPFVRSLDALKDFFGEELPEFIELLVAGQGIKDGIDAARYLKFGTALKGLGKGGALLAGLGIGFSFYDLFAESEGYTGGFSVVESSADVLGVISGGLGVAAGIVAATGVGAPVAAALAVASIGVAGVSMVMDVGLELWDRQGGRELFRSVSRSVSEGFTEVASTVDDTWDRAYEAGTGMARDAVDVVGDGAEAVARGADRAWGNVYESGRGLFKKVRGWF